MEYTNRSLSAEPFNHSSFMAAVYTWMSIALIVSITVAYIFSTDPALYVPLFQNGLLFWVLMALQVGIVLFLSAMINRLRLITALVMFFIYAALNGVTLSTIFMLYELPSLVTTLAVTAGMFGSMALYGYYTKKDLGSYGSLALLVVWGLILSTLINVWLGNQLISFVISAAGVVIFSFLTAYDVQKIKTIAYEHSTNGRSPGAIGVLGALILYLDFINMFLYLLQFLGNKKGRR